MRRRDFNKIIPASFLGLGHSRPSSTGTTAKSILDDPVDEVVNIGSRLELFIDRYLIDKLENVQLRLHEPRSSPLSKSPLPVGYTTVIKEDSLYRGYYLDYRPDYDGELLDGNPGEILCYAESINGHDWNFPDLNIVDITGPQGRNVILAERPFCHSFSPFIDGRHTVDDKERYKALAGAREQVFKRATGHTGGGLFAFVSDDGIHWRRKHDKPVIPYQNTSPAGETMFDSLNVVFWSEIEQLYVCYFRTIETPHGRLRTISRVTSSDFINWSKPVPMHPNRPGEHLYTNNTHPYFRAPHIYLSLPTRVLPDRGHSTDILLMSTRAGAEEYERLFTEAFIRPGLDQSRWGNRSNFVAQNVVPTGRDEISIYHSDNHRYVLRTDGFVSVRAGSEQGTMLTRPLVFSGNSLIVNYSSSAAGSLHVELQEKSGVAISKFCLSKCNAIVGDEIERIIQWKGNPSLGDLSGNPVRVKFVMNECDLFSFRFS
jgi:hypothetical protein